MGYLNRESIESDCSIPKFRHDATPLLLYRLLCDIGGRNQFALAKQYDGGTRGDYGSEHALCMYPFDASLETSE